MWNFLATAMLIVAGATSVFGQPTAQTTGGSFHKGQTEVGILLGAGSAMDIWGGLPDSEFVSMGVRLSRVVTGPIAAGPCRGNLLISAEVYPAGFFYEDDGTTYTFTALMVLRYHFAPGARIRPFISAGIGPVLSRDPIPRGISKVNYAPQGGAGLAVPLRSGAVLSMEYRIHHMSGGSLPVANPGANSNAFLVGLAWLR